MIHLLQTDHDPRNPAYIATQGPLPHTVADFWQMVWEQGSVVIVMLTRLTENGVSMCQRYWPEEGSELYHIYEVGPCCTPSTFSLLWRSLEALSACMTLVYMLACLPKIDLIMSLQVHSMSLPCVQAGTVFLVKPPSRRVIPFIPWWVFNSTYCYVCFECNLLGWTSIYQKCQHLENVTFVSLSCCIKVH